jgi:hypothetical protein
MKEVAIPWDTTGLGGRTMRVYVTVDPEDTVPGEIHEWKVDGERAPNGNNEGYWPWGTELPVLSVPESPSQATEPSTFRFDDDALAVFEPDGQRASDLASLGRDRTYLLRAHLQTDRDADAPVAVLFSDGHPARGGETLALKMVRGLQAGDNYVWTEWTPTRAGGHDLWVTVLDTRRRERNGSGGRLRVTVQ